MNIYLVTRTDHVDWDECAGHVVVANTEQEAREMCGWGDGEPEPSQIKATCIGTTNAAGDAEAAEGGGIILTDFNAG